MKTYQEIGRNLSALEAFPKEWIREIGERIRIPVKPDIWVFALLWKNAGLSMRQIRKLAGKQNGCLITYERMETMLSLQGHRLDTLETLDYWREKWRKYKGRSKWRKL